MPRTSSVSLQLDLDLPIHKGESVRLKGDGTDVIGEVLGCTQTCVYVRWPGCLPDWYYYTELDRVTDDA